MVRQEYALVEALHATGNLDTFYSHFASDEKVHAKLYKEALNLDSEQISLLPMPTDDAHGSRKIRNHAGRRQRYKRYSGTPPTKTKKRGDVLIDTAPKAITSPGDTHRSVPQ